MKPRGANSRNGFALLIVLWTLVLLALMVTQLTAVGRGEARLAHNLRTDAVLQAEADGALYEAVFHVIDASNRHWAPDGTPHRLRLAHGTAEIRIDNQAGKLNPNGASLDLLRVLLRELGADPHSAEGLAAAILDWRTPGQIPRPLGAKAPQYRAAGLEYGPPGAPFQSLDELHLVLGMTPDLLARLRPLLSIYQPGDPYRPLIDPVLAQAIRDLGEEAGDLDLDTPRDTLVVAITATVTGTNGGRFARRAIVTIGGQFGGTPYKVLTWDRVES